MSTSLPKNFVPKNDREALAAFDARRHTHCRLASMKSFSARALLVTAIVCSAFAACGGTIEQGQSGSSGGSTSGGGTSTNADAGRAVSDADVTTDSEAGICVDIETTDFDMSCNADTDCIEIMEGSICSGYNCDCPGASINVDGQDRYTALVGSVLRGPGRCECPAFGRPHCIQGTCTFCWTSVGGGGPAGCPDAG
jgi:hypothetical protein